MLTWADLHPPDARALALRFRALLGVVVAADTTSTRSDDQLNQLCNLLLLKLESDRRARLQPGEPVAFQAGADEAATARAIRAGFAALRDAHGELFSAHADRELRLDAGTIHHACAELGAIRLQGGDVDAVSFAFQVFRAASLKAEEGQYFTPGPVIRSAAAVMDVQPDDRVLDPACGTGGFLLACAGRARTVCGVDKDPINVKLTRAMLLIHGAADARACLGDSLRASLPLLADDSYTCIITNPPFGESLKLGAADARAGGYSICQHPQDAARHVDREVGLAFLERCWRLLQRGGRLGIVLPETYLFSASYQWIHDWLQPRLLVRGMFNIPMEAFQGFCRAKTNFYVFEKL